MIPLDKLTGDLADFTRLVDELQRDWDAYRRRLDVVVKRFPPRDGGVPNKLPPSDK
jgi:hypothetical protein